MSCSLQMATGVAYGLKEPSPEPTPKYNVAISADGVVMKVIKGK